MTISQVLKKFNQNSLIINITLKDIIKISNQ